MKNEKNAKGKRILLVCGILIILLLGANVYAGTQGYNNIFFMIRNLITHEEINGKEEILTDRNNINDEFSEKEKIHSYKEITEKLNDIDVLYVTDAINNSNDTYTLKGVIYTPYTLSSEEVSEIVKKGEMKINNKTYILKDSNIEREYNLYESQGAYDPLYKIKPKTPNSYYLETQAQIENNWKLTDQLKQITVSKNTKCTMTFDYEEKYNIVEDVFSDFKSTEPIETTNPNADRTFIFKFENGKCVEVNSALTSMQNELPR